VSVLVVTEQPVTSGLHKSVLDGLLKAHGEEYEIHSVFPRMEIKTLKKMKAEDWLAQTPEIHAKAKAHKKILCCGSLAAAATFEADTSIPVTKVRGRSFMAKIGRAQRYTIITYPPSTVIRDTDFFRDLAFDIQKLCTHSKPIEQKELEIVLVERAKDLSLLKELHGASFLSCDIETTALNPYHAEILGIGFAALEQDDSGYVVVVPQQLVNARVHSFMKQYQGTFVFHNGKFDIQHLWKKWGRFDFNMADTMLMHWCLDERPFNRYRSHSLDLLQRLYYDAPPKSVKMVDWLEEYFREDVGKKARRKFIEDFCYEHPEKARSLWRKAYEEAHGEEPDWRGRKVGRDIEVDEVAEYIPLPKAMRPAPDKARRAEMWDAMMRYMGEDCYYTARLYKDLEREMVEESPRLVTLHDKYLIPASKAFAAMELTGAHVDRPYLETMKTEITAILADEMKTIRAIVQEHTEHPHGEDFNPNSSKQVREVLYNAGDEGGLGLAMPRDVGRYAYKRSSDEVTTNSDTLKVLARQCSKTMPAAAKLINLILSYRVKSKIIGTYIDGLLQRTDPDGRIRGDFNLHGTATARISCSNPNLQNIPDASHVGYDIRKAYTATPGWTILEADFSQLELRVAALFSQDHVLIEAYENGADIHQEVAYMLWNKPKDEITKYERYLAKCMNFGVLYGRGARSIATGPEMDNLVEMSGRSWGNKEIDAYFAKFKEGYIDLFAWMDLVKRDSMAKQYVENPLGHRRRFDCILESEVGHIQRQTVNTPIQGFAAQMTVNALIQLDAEFDPSKQRVLFTVHDSIMCECISDSDVIQETADLIKRIMETRLPEDVVMSLPTLNHSPFKQGDDLLYNLPFVADVAVGPTWADCKDEAEHYVVRTYEQVEEGVRT